jgi:hypothetical protein
MAYNLRTIQIKDKYFVEVRSDERTPEQIATSEWFTKNCPQSTVDDIQIHTHETDLPKSLSLAKKQQMVTAYQLAGVSLNLNALQ